MSNAKRPTPKSAQGKQAAGQPAKWVLPVVVVGVVVLALVVGVVTYFSVSGSSDDSSGGDASQKVEVAQVVTISGEALPQLPESGVDPAVGMPAPVASGVDPQGAPVAVPTKGPAVTAIVAHWCPHCQREVPVIMDLRRNGSWPANVTLGGISTGVSPERGNYPPSAWLTSEGWDAPVLVDTSKAQAAKAYGLTGFPFLVWTDASGKVVLRTSGEIPEAQFARMLRQLSEGQTPTRNLS